MGKICKLLTKLLNIVRTYGWIWLKVYIPNDIDYILFPVCSAFIALNVLTDMSEKTK